MGNDRNGRKRRTDIASENNEHENVNVETQTINGNEQMLLQFSFISFSHKYYANSKTYTKDTLDNNSQNLEETATTHLKIIKTIQISVALKTKIVQI